MSDQLINLNDSLATNVTYCVDQANSSVQPFVPAIWIQWSWASVFGLMVTAAVIGNVLVIWIVTWHKAMRSVTNLLLLNLSVADLMMATMNAIFNFVFMIHSDWPFGETYCVINNFIATVTVASSVFTITAMSIDR